MHVLDSFIVQDLYSSLLTPILYILAFLKEVYYLLAFEIAQVTHRFNAFDVACILVNESVQTLTLAASYQSL